ncbi:hypothetical protein [Lysinibacillus sphaericus]|uniref:hypothetical protein n=1 Tax=Lysinibacillus sphaericus TaxID=1421 RepID=UPI001CBB0F33|nr:hypothetical protein [Lysinibacillus sphaericus]
MKKLIYAAGLSLGLSFFGMSSSAFASESVDSLSNQDLVEQNASFEKEENGLINPSKRSLGTEHPTPYSQITTYSDGSVTGVDFSEATFYDEEGNVIEPPIDSDTDLITPLSDGTTGGSWSSGSGYSCVTGVTVYAGRLAPIVDMRFKADFCTYKDSYDKISRVYKESVEAYEWSFLDQGVFRDTETLDYSAYGGIKAQVRHKKDGALRTDYVYLRVKDDSYWVDSSF